MPALSLHDLQTPAILIDAPRLAANIKRMQARADQNGVALRPHTKTHKSVRIAQMQQQAGAQGFTVAKTGEAETLVAAGFMDIRLAYPIVGEEKHQRLLKLIQQGARISFCVDTQAGALAASDFYAAHGLQAEVLVEVDVNYGRTGVPWNRQTSIDFVKWVRRLAGLKLTGILCHAGQSYHGPEHDAEPLDKALMRVAKEERGMMLSFASRLKAAGAADPLDFEISIGSTPSVRYFEQQTRDDFRITEIRPGNYVFHDATMVALEACGGMECALTVLSTVVSKQRNLRGQEKLYLDAGKKILTSDARFGAAGYGQVLYNPNRTLPNPHTRIVALSEEHAWVQVAGGATMEVGDRVRILPNHACVVVNTQNQMYLVEGETVLETLAIEGRGRCD